MSDFYCPTWCTMPASEHSNALFGSYAHTSAVHSGEGWQFQVCGSYSRAGEIDPEDPLQFFVSGEALPLEAALALGEVAREIAQVEQ